MSVETTRRTMEPYIHALLSGDYARFLDDDAHVHGNRAGSSWGANAVTSRWCTRRPSKPTSR